MKKYAFLFILLLLIPVYIYATDGVNTVEHPAKVNSVATPDKVCGVSGLAGGGGEETLRPNGSGYSAWDASAGDYWDCVGDENDATYVYETGSNQSLRVAMENTSTSSGKTITSVTEYFRVKCETGTCTDDLLVKLHNGSAYTLDITTITPTGSITNILGKTYTTNPWTSNPWTSAEIDAIYGAMKTATLSSAQIRVYEIWFVVAHSD